jgi:hypothetical protein
LTPEGGTERLLQFFFGKFSGQRIPSASASFVFFSHDASHCSADLLRTERRVTCAADSLGIAWTMTPGASSAADHEGDEWISAHAGRRIGVASRAGGLLVSVLFSPKKEPTPIISSFQVFLY